ncbi:MAG: PfkB family carbohydrate kinase [Armatimonadota bacterium]
MPADQRSPAVLVVGSVALDTVATPAGEASEVLGGAATYSALSASFFTRVLLVGVVGTDFPREHVDLLASRNIDLEGLQTMEGPTFRWSGRYSGDMNQAQTLDTQLGVFASFRPSLPKPYRDAQYVLLANIDPDLQLDVLRQVHKPRLVACDTMNFWIAGKRDALLSVLSAADVAFMNDAEAQQLTGEANLVRAARRVLDLGPEAVVIKRGAHGASLFTPDDSCSVPAYPLDRVADPTGAGDTFEGGFMGYIAAVDDPSPENLRKAVAYGTVMASFDVEDFSVRRLLSLTTAEISKRYRELRHIATFDAPDGPCLFDTDV